MSYICLEASYRYKLSKSRLEVIVHFQVGFTTLTGAGHSTDTNNMCVYLYVCVHTHICMYFCIAEPNTGVSVYMELSPPSFSFSQDTLHLSTLSSVYFWFLVITSLVYVLPHDLHSVSTPTPPGRILSQLLQFRFLREVNSVNLAHFCLRRDPHARPYTRLELAPLGTGAILSPAR